MLALLMYHQVGRRPYRAPEVLLNAWRRPALDGPPVRLTTRPPTPCGLAVAEEEGKTSFR